MGAYKQFTTKDVVQTPFVINAGFNFVGNAITGSIVGIEFYRGINPISNIFVSSSAPTTGFLYIENTTGIYNSIKQLYYTNYLTSSLGDNFPTQSIIPGVKSSDNRYVGELGGPRFDNYLQSTLTQSRYFPTASGAEISVISIPSKLFGENIVPYTFEFTYTSSGGNKYSITDDGDGNLISSSVVVGQIFYSHGLAVFTTGALATLTNTIISGSFTGGVYGTGSYGTSSYGGNYNNNLSSASVAFSSSYTLYENQYKCVIRENEFGYSMNPSIRSGSNNDVYYDFATGSYFNPYVTTIGLYNDYQELIAVAKLSNPIPVSDKTDTTIIVNFDL